MRVAEFRSETQGHERPRRYDVTVHHPGPCQVFTRVNRMTRLSTRLSKYEAVEEC